MLKLWKAMRSKNACKTCALGMGGQAGRHGQRGGPLSRGLQEIAAGHGRRHARGHPARVLRAPIRIAQLQAFSPRELESCGRLTSRRAAEHGAQYYRPIAWDDAFEPHRRASSKRSSPDETLLVFQRPQLATKPAFCCNFSPGCTARTTSTTAATTATRPAASA